MKPEHKELLRERARRALGDLYHNATLPCIRGLYGRSEEYANAWLSDAAQFEIEYIANGGANGRNYRATLAHPANAGKYKSEKARAYYIAKGMRAYREELADCGMLTGWRALELAAGNGRTAGLMAQYPNAKRNNALWEKITDYGKLYQWGRGGRTLAPDGLISQRGGSSFSIREDAATDCSIADCVELIRIVESFNRYVGAWCAYVPDMWREHCAEEDAETLRQKRAAAARKAKETRERNYWACRGMVTA